MALALRWGYSLSMATKGCVDCKVKQDETGRRGANCTECARLSSQKYRDENREKYNKYMREYQKVKYVELRCEVFDALGRVCSHCGYNNERALDIDHIDGGGGKHRKGLASASYMRQILKEIGRYRILCKNCNWLAYLDSIAS